MYLWLPTTLCNNAVHNASFYANAQEVCTCMLILLPEGGWTIALLALFSAIAIHNSALTFACALF